MKPKKMSRQDLIDLFPAYDPQGFKPSRATNKGFAHKVNPAYKAPKAKISPAEWKRAGRKVRTAAKAGKAK